MNKNLEMTVKELEVLKANVSYINEKYSELLLLHHPKTNDEIINILSGAIEMMEFYNEYARASKYDREQYHVYSFLHKEFLEGKRNISDTLDKIAKATIVKHQYINDIVVVLENGVKLGALSYYRNEMQISVNDLIGLTIPQVKELYI